jgi:Txe/YoeB family toxin of Txe-Axe toxin-antitoxin module
MEEIKAWLQDPDRNYFDGIALFEKYGTNMTMVYNLRRINSTGNEERLIYELGKIADLPEEEVLAIFIPVVEEQIVEGEQKPERKNSDLLQGLLDQRAAMYSDRNVISDTLADLQGEELKVASERVQKLDDEIIALTTQIQFVEANGHLPVPKVDLVEDLEAFKKKRKSLGEKLSRIKSELKTTPGNLKKEAALVEIQSQMEGLDLKIKALTQAT